MVSALEQTALVGLQPWHCSVPLPMVLAATISGPRRCMALEWAAGFQEFPLGIPDGMRPDPGFPDPW